MSVALSPSQVSRLLGKMIPAKLPVLLTGPPGVGKSDVLARAASDAGADLILSHPAVADPTDAKGLPWISDSKTEATFLPFGELARALRASKLTVWFLDDFGQAPAAVQASYMQLLLARRVNGHCLPDCVTFVAATNRRTDKAGVSGILEPVKSRFAAIIEMRADLDEWCQWAFLNGVKPELVAFLRFRPDLLCAFQASADIVQSPLPRTWAYASRLLSLGIDKDLELPALTGAVGEGAAVEFTAFLRMFRELPSIDGILVDPDAATIPDGPAALYAVTAGLATKANAKNFGRIARYAQRLSDAKRGEFAALLVRDAVRRDAEIQHTEAFVRMTSTELGQLMSGAV